MVNLPPEVLERISKQQGASERKEKSQPPDKKEIRTIWNSPELQGLGRILARLKIDPANSRALEVCLDRAYDASYRALDEELKAACLERRTISYQSNKIGTRPNRRMEWRRRGRPRSGGNGILWSNWRSFVQNDRGTDWSRLGSEGDRMRRETRA